MVGTHPPYFISEKQLNDHEKRKPASKTASPQSANEHAEAGFISLHKCTCEINCREESARKCKITNDISQSKCFPGHLPQENTGKS